MLSLAAFRYRNVLASHGGPVGQIETGVFSVRGRPMFQANAQLVAGLTRKPPLNIYGDADGTGTHRSASVARHIAVSEAIERWAYHAVARSARAGEFGFEIDPSSNGMSAFPGISRRSGRRKALLEAIERFSLINWWEGLAEGQRIETDWPGVSAVVIDSPLGGVTAVVFARTEWGGYAYGHAAEESLGAACEAALVELARHEWVLRSRQLAVLAGEERLPTDLFERRCLFFSTPDGHELFRQRMRGGGRKTTPRPIVACDREIPGPWAVYASVWRFALRPPSLDFLEADERYFFW